MGALVTREHRDRVASYVDAGEEHGVNIVVDGRDVQPHGDENGFWLGPVLSVLRVDTYEHALELVNSNEWGNGTAIVTNDGGAARRFQNEVAQPGSAAPVVKARRNRSSASSGSADAQASRATTPS